MPRNISFHLTTRQFKDGTKDVTRRAGWLLLKVGDELVAVRKAQGLKKGQKVQRLGRIRVNAVMREKLSALLDGPDYGRTEVNREGFPEMSPAEFVDFFCKSHKGVTPDTYITRIAFERIGK